MSTPPNNERSSRKWIKKKVYSVFSPSKSQSRNLEVPDARSTSVNFPPIQVNASFQTAHDRENSPSDGPRIIANRTRSGEWINFNHNPRFELLLNTPSSEGHASISDVQPSLFTGSSTPVNVTTGTSTSSLTSWLTLKDINHRP